LVLPLPITLSIIWIPFTFYYLYYLHLYSHRLYYLHVQAYTL